MKELKSKQNQIFKNHYMKQSSVISKMKKKVSGIYMIDFTPNEHEAADALVLLQTLSQKKQIIRKFKITFCGKRVCERIYNNNDNVVFPSLQINIPNVVHSSPQINIPNVVVMGNGNNLPNIPTIPGVPNNYILGCCKPFEKKLSNSDLRVDLNRLFLDKSHVKEYFLPLLKEGEDLEEGINVNVYDMQGNIFQMKFKFWCKLFYVLTGGWKTFFKSHSLEANQDHVTVWMFRHLETDKLCFALSVRRA